MTNIRVVLALLMGVASLRVAECSDQSDISLPYDQPIGTLENDAGKRRVATPEVVLQLKYDKGELNRIYLAQFRKEKELWTPSVPARTNLCADLCHAGLGGTPCGISCPEMLPVGLKAALSGGNRTDSSYGEPRVAVCPGLCRNHLGDPLCNCRAQEATEAEETESNVDWSEICTAFCVTDRYVLSVGQQMYPQRCASVCCPYNKCCPPCEVPSTSQPEFASSRILNTVEGWTAWCGVQCHQGQGGAACNCDRAPFQ